MATNPVSNAQSNGVYDLYKTSLQAKTEKADTEQRQAMLTAAKADTANANNANRVAEERRRVDEQSATTKPQTTNLQGQLVGGLLNVNA